MFEEVPRQRRGLAGLTARRLVLGPFVVGGGLALATLGGSVAVAASVITASTIGLPAIGPLHDRARPAPDVASSSPSAGARPGAVPTAASGSGSGTTGLHHPGAPVSIAGSLPVTGTPRAPAGPSDIAAPGGAASPGRASASSAASASAGSSATSTGPAGNAVIHVEGYDSSTGELQFRYAVAQAGLGGQPHFVTVTGRQYEVAIAAGIQITSGGTLCPPAGSSCTTEQLVRASADGFFAEVAIDADAALRSVIELDSAPALGSASAAPSPSTTSPQPSVTRYNTIAPSPGATVSPSPTAS
ncbi:hypothetical protein BH10ACT8_BH10ACT8_21240 [soil metagenome]